MGGSDNKGDGLASQPRRYRVPGQPLLNRHHGWCLPQPRWAVCATRAGAHEGQTNGEGEKDIWRTARTARGGTFLHALSGPLYRARGPHKNTARQAMDGLWTEVCGQQKQSNDPGNN